MNALQLLLILKARKKLILLTLIASVVIVTGISLLLPKAYTATASLVVNMQRTDPITGLSAPNQFASSYLATQVDIISSHNVALKVVDDLKLAQAPGYQAQFQKKVEGQISIREWIANSLLANLEVRPSRQSNVLYVVYKSANPQMAASLANAFVKAYIQTNLEHKTQPAQQTAAWFDAQLGELRSNLEQKQAKLSSYQQHKGLVSLDDRLDTESTRLAELSSQLAVTQGQTYESLSIQRNASNASASVMNNPVIQTLKADLARSEAKLSQLAPRVGNNHPEYQRAMAEVESLRVELSREMGTARQGMQSNLSVSQQREGALRAAVAGQKDRVLALNAQRDEAGVLAREVESAQKAFDQALQRYTQTKLEGHIGQTEVAVLSAAVTPLVPATPNIPLNIMLSIMLGVLLGLGLALIMEMLGRRVYSEYDVVACLGVPVLGVLVASNKQRLSNLGWLGLPAPKAI